MPDAANPIDCVYRLASPPPTGNSAVAIVELSGDIDAAFVAMRLDPVRQHEVRLRRWTNVDEVVVARLATDHALLFPHAGPAVLARVLSAIAGAGLSHARPDDPRTVYPEAASLLEARVLDALSRAQSPLAIDLLLAQPQRLAAASNTPGAILSENDSRLLRRLIEPPLVIAAGASNIGKSSLLNALAGRQVAIVADVPGTTRDHVGVHLDIAGLVVRYLDAPGLDAATSTHDQTLRDAQSLARHAAAAADLVLLCCDAVHPPIPSPAPSDVPTLTVALRSDLGTSICPADVVTSVRESTGLTELTAAIREALVPARLLRDPRAWQLG